MQLKHANIGTIMYVVIYTFAVISALATPLTANIFESGPMPTPSKFLAGPSLLPGSKIG